MQIVLMICILRSQGGGTTVKGAQFNQNFCTKIRFLYGVKCDTRSILSDSGVSAGTTWAYLFKAFFDRPTPTKSLLHQIEPEKAEWCQKHPNQTERTVYHI